MQDNKKDILIRVYVIYGLMVLLALAIIFIVFQIQFGQGKEWGEKAKHLTIKDIIVEAERVSIYASDVSLLATSVPFYEVAIDLTVKPLDKCFDEEVDSLALCLSQLFKDKTKQEYKRELIIKRNQNRQYHVINRNVTYPQLKKIKKN